jgi:hypothetical protein
MQMRFLVSALLALVLPSVPLAAAERVCDQSDPVVTPSPDGRWAASVQHQVCETDAGGVAAAITVFVGAPGAALQGGRVAATAVPRSHAEWPRVVWRSGSQLEVWVPNLAQVLETTSGYREVAVALKYCQDDPDARAQVARYKVEMQRWMEAVTRWVELRNTDPQAAGARPQRPEEPRIQPRACSDADIKVDHG